MSKIGRPKGRKNSRPRPKPASRQNLAGDAAINDAFSGATNLPKSFDELLELVLRSDPEPDINFPTIIKRHLLKNPRLLQWFLERYYGKPGERLEATGAGGGPMEIKLVIETIGGEE